MLDNNAFCQYLNSHRCEEKLTSLYGYSYKTALKQSIEFIQIGDNVSAISVLRGPIIYGMLCLWEEPENDDIRNMDGGKEYDQWLSQATSLTEKIIAQLIKKHRP